MVTCISTFDWRKRFDSGQTILNYAKLPNSKISFKNMLTLSSFVSGFQKSHLFLCKTIRNAKKAFQKVTSSLFPCFVNSTAKNNDTALKFGMYVVRMWVYNIYSGFSITSKFWDLEPFVFEK